MITARLKRWSLPPLRRATVGLLLGALTLALPSPAAASEPPIKEILTSHIGWEVDEVTKGPVCTVISGHKCQPAAPSSEPGGFLGTKSVAGGGAPEGHIYITDGANHRVQELNSSGEFIAMFGWDVNQTKKKEGAPQPERNVCTKASGDICQPGTEGTKPGQFSVPTSIAVDQSNDDFYVAEIASGKASLLWRVQKFTAEGQFLLELGKEVNESTKGNLCTQAEIANCKGPAETATPEPGAFNFAAGSDGGGILAVGGPEAHLYVGDEHTVQEFRPDGTWAGEPLAKTEAIAHRLAEISSAPESDVTRIAVDKAGTVYLGYSIGKSVPTAIIEFDSTGKEVTSFATGVLGLAVDAAGRLAVVGAGSATLDEVVGSKLHRITEISGASGDAVNFNGNDELYAVGGNERELLASRPVPVAELALGEIKCHEGAVHETSVTVDCSLNGTVNPEGVSETEAWFRWGSTPALGQETPRQPLATGNASVPLSAPIEGARPNEPLYRQVAAEDQNVKAPELLTTELEVVQVPPVPPRVLGGLGASFLRSASAVLAGSLNPENASTVYDFEYGPCHEACATSPFTAATSTRESSAYSPTKAIIEASDLQPATEYHYRLTAVNQGGTALNETGEPGLPEGTFTTAPAPVPQAVTTTPTAVGTTSATITGTANPDGQPSTYSFEMGVYNSGATQYGVVFTGPAGAGTLPVGETFNLTGLQPGTQYAYRIVVRSGFGESVGAPVVFTTAGLSAALALPGVLAQLSVPGIAFPAEAAHGTPRKLTRAQQLARALKACAKRPRVRRAACRRSARSKYAANTKAKKAIATRAAYWRGTR
ncbi:MAG TPA: hypothetical protein VNY27_00825 [Solirubrobacteraceae bacterium]|jgi:hypothetical protein|nr:hypothetical protein [Solirubrobacteraceae bacterium]